MRLITVLFLVLLLCACDSRKIKHSGFEDLLLGSYSIILYENNEFFLELGAGGTEGKYGSRNDTVFRYDKPVG